MRLFGLLSILSLLAACHSGADSSRASADANILTKADFEQSIGWGDASPASLTTERARSGKWSVRVKPDVPYSYTYARKVGDLGTPPPTKMVLEGWVLRVAAGSTAKLVVQVNASDTEDKKVFYTAFPVEQAVPKFGKWMLVSVPLTLPGTIMATNQLKVYLWNDQATTSTYLDDVMLRKAN